MIANVSAHRRANAFAHALESLDNQDLQDASAEQPGSSAESAEGDRLLALASGLGEVPKPVLDAEVKATQRARLIAAMEAAFAEGAPQVPEQRAAKSGAHRARSLNRLRPRSRWSKGLAAGGLTVGVAAGAFGGIAAASTDALPGDTLYGLKRGMEDFKLGMADGDADRGRIYLDQASIRMSEARRLMERVRSGDLDHESLGEIRRVLSGMHHDVSEGHRLLHGVYERDGSLGVIQTLSSFSSSHRQGWGELRDRLPMQLADVSGQVSSTFDAIDDEVGPLQSLLPSSPDGKARTGKESGGAPRHGGSKSAEHPAPSSTGHGDGHSKGADRPGPSSSKGDEHQGLIGGGGLLDPSKDDSASPSSGTHDPGDGAPRPDITIPPLLPGLLPGLGIDGEDVK